MCFILPKKFPHVLQKTFFYRKHDFNRKLEGGTGLQGVSSNLNLETINLLQPIIIGVFVIRPFSLQDFDPTSQFNTIQD